MTSSPELIWAHAAVAQAMVVCESIRSTLDAKQDARAKTDHSPVTLADLACQAVIAHSLRHIFPSDPLVGEEDTDVFMGPEGQRLLARVAEVGGKSIPGFSLEAAATSIALGQGLGGSTGRFWTLDPIDGTKGFLRGGQYAIALALIENGKVRLGVLGCPNLPHPKQNTCGCLFAAERGTGAHMTTAASGVEAIQVHASALGVGEIHRAVFAESYESGHSAHGESQQIATRLGITAPPIRMDSQAKYGLIARGESDIYLRLPTRPDYEEKIWDHAAGLVIVEEAGGRVSDINGKPLDFGRGRTLSANRGVVATNGHLHDQVLKAVQAGTISI